MLPIRNEAQWFTGELKTLLKIDAALLAVGLSAYLRLLYVATHSVHSPEQALGATLEPVNFVAVILTYLCGAGFALFSLLTLGWYLVALFLCRRRNTFDSKAPR